MEMLDQNNNIPQEGWFGTAILHDKIQLLFRQLPYALIAQCLVIGSMVSVLWTPPVPLTVMLWLAYILSCITVWTMVFFRYKTLSKPCNEKRWLMYFHICALATALGWGLLASVLMPENNLLAQFFIIIFIIGIITGAIPFFSPIFTLYCAFLIPSFLPLIVWLFQKGGIYTHIGYCGIVYIGIMIASCFHLSKTINRSLSCQYQLFFQAHHDILTKLPNRILLYDRIHQALLSAKRNKLQVIILFLDLDDFKSINDTFGHDKGDGVLREITQRLMESTRKTDTVSRFGGDEFVIILQVQKEEDAAQICQKILTNIQRPIRIYNQERIITTTIGYSVYPNDGEDTATLLKNADIAMYRAKHKGRNCYLPYSKV